MKNAVILGCGRVGATIARDLARDERLRVTAADARAGALDDLRRIAPRIQTAVIDLASPAAIRGAIAEADVVVGALPSALGLMALRTVSECGKRYSDISFMPEDALALHDLARKHNTTAVVDCGVAPGLANLILGRCAVEMEAIEDAVYYVGGLPKTRIWPYQYRAPFAPLDVLEEYTRPARMIEHGQIVTRPALTEPELIDFPRVGTLEAFNTDGLRSLLTTVRATNLREKTLRYPGHAELMRVLRETGYFDKNEIQVGPARVRPIDLTARLLFPHWQPAPGETEFTVLRVEAAGRLRGAAVRRRFDLYDETDVPAGESSMARTTGFPAAIVARMLAFGDLSETGVFAPEQLAGRGGVLDHIVAELGRRGVRIEESTVA